MSYILQIAHQNNHKLREIRNCPGTQPNNKSCTKFYHCFQLWFKLSRTKTEYMMCDFSATRHEGGDVSLDGQVVVQKDTFRYLGSVLQNDGDIDEDVRHKISAGWLKWRQASGILCDKRVAQKLKGKFYRTAIRPVMLYGAEC